ncbi:hypothetical protein [Acanthopleuribacter pedis]|uniref:Uncharacterized protein n=1 Tax=Acanthopleuribacter pedis TaxID=442870 RepID=A0A8J7QAX0_9BACT|nr:hypothetical protein [Acanthopleuribacter pedis]MBO1320724.1 hypothetical protein [Acanthopleuribacter pedis]
MTSLPAFRADLSSRLLSRRALTRFGLMVSAACLWAFSAAAQTIPHPIEVPLPDGLKMIGGGDTVVHSIASNTLILENRGLTIRGDAQLEYVSLNNARLKVLGQGSVEPMRPAALPDHPVLQCGTIELNGESILSADYIRADRLIIGENAVVEGGRQQLPLMWGDLLYEDPSIPGSYGGQGALVDRDQIVFANPTHGSFAEPFAAGGERKSVRIDCRELVVNGKILSAINADQVPSNGAVWITTEILAGNGRIDASARGIAAEQGQGGGRIAVYFHSADNWSGTMHAKGAGMNDVLGVTEDAEDNDKNVIERFSSGGTIYTKSASQRFGDLTIGESETLEQNAVTPLVSLGQLRLITADTNEDNTLTVGHALPPGLAGLYLLIETPSRTLEYPIVDSQYNQIQVDGNLPVIPVGTVISARVRVNNLRIEQGSVMVSRDPLFVHGSVVVDGNSVTRRVLQVPVITMPERPTRHDRDSDGDVDIVIDIHRGN